MFCQKCGKELVEGLVFCGSCGAPVQIQGEATNAESTVLQKNITNTSAAARRSKPWYKRWWIWVIAAVVVLFILAAIGSGDSETALSQTYTNEAEGISFKYQSTWKMVPDTSLDEYYDESETEDIVVLFENGQKDQQDYSLLEIQKIPTNKEGIDGIFSAAESDFAEAFSEGTTIDLLSDISLDGVPARMLVYTMDKEECCRRYYYAVGNTMYMIDFLYPASEAESLGKIFDAIMKSYKITAPENPYPDEILYDGVPISQIFQTKAQDIRDLLGEPAYIEDGEAAVYRYGVVAGEGSMACLNYNQDGHLNEINAYGFDRFTFNGTPLSGKSRAELAEILGEPDGESGPGNSKAEYSMNWQYSDYSVEMLINSTNPEPEEVPFTATFRNKDWIPDPIVNSNMIDENFEWVERPNMQGNYIGSGIYQTKIGSIISGIIRNTTDKTFSYVSISFKLYDSDGNQVGTTYDSISNLSGGNTWKFKATTGDDSVTRAEFDDITAW